MLVPDAEQKLMNMRRVAAQRLADAHADYSAEPSSWAEAELHRACEFAGFVEGTWASLIVHEDD